MGQAQNYLRALDEQRSTIFTEMGINCRRSSATVVIGHSRKVRSVDAEQVRDTLRTYNSHLARIEVRPYDELIENAYRAVDFSAISTKRDG